MTKVLAHMFIVMAFVGCNMKDRNGGTDIYSHKHNVKYSFQPLGEVVLNYTDSMFVGRLRSFAVCRDGSLSLGDNLDCKVKIFSPDGKFIRSVSRKGSGPGETQGLRWHCIDDSGQVWVSDHVLHRVSVYDTSGAVQRTWSPIDGCDNCVFRGTIRVVNSRIYVGIARTVPKPVRAADISSLVTAFDFQYKPIAEYGKYDQNVKDYRLEPAYVFGIDSSGNFYFIHDQSNIIWKCSIDGRTIKGFNYPVAEYRPMKEQPPSGPAGRREWAEWYASATAVGNMELVGKYVFITFANRDLEYFTSYENRYRHEYLQVFDLDGNCLVDFINAPGQFLGCDRKGVLYFLVENEPDRMVISKHRFALDLPPKK